MPTTTPAPAEDRKRTFWTLALFFALAFVITWGIGAALILARPQLEAVVGPIGQVNHHWIYYLAVSAPTLSAIVCSFVFGGVCGVKALALRFVRPFHPAWLAIAILIWPAALALFGLAAREIGMTGLIDLRAIAIGAPVLALTTAALVVDPGGLGEETGWRGFALPRLITLMRPLDASLLLGLIWGLWHLPGFFVSGLAQSHLALGWFLGGSVCLSVTMTWLFVRANGNPIVAGIVPHLVTNLMSDANVFARDSIQVETIVLALIALFLVARYGRDLGPRLAARPSLGVASVTGEPSSPRGAA
jgi:membrane protease YdiL (CAAX protease family)